MLRKYGIISLFAALLSACAQPITIGPSVSKQEITQEQALQQQAASKHRLEAQEKLEREHLAMQQRLLAVTGKISRAGATLCGTLVQAKQLCVYPFELQKDEVKLNASADGKKIMITPAMMRFAKTDEELAIVLSHEFSHNMLGHIDAKRGNAMVGLVVGALVDGLAASRGLHNPGLGNVGMRAGAGAYSVDFEKEADYVGLYIMAIAGYDISHAPDFWRRMAVRTPDSIAISTTHPTTPERFVLLTKTVEEIKEKQRRNLPLMPERKAAKTI